MRKKTAFSVAEVTSVKIKTLELTGEWYDLLGTPERCGVWFVWGHSGNGKTNFVLQLCKELCKHDRVAYNSLEEGISLNMQRALTQNHMKDAGRRFVLLNRESMEDLSVRIKKHKSPHVYVIDSFQRSRITYKEFTDFASKHRNKLIIFVSQADGKQPLGRSACRAVFDADQKIFVEGYVATTKGRSFGPTGEYVIWREGAEKYWGSELKTDNDYEYKKSDDRDYASGADSAGNDSVGTDDMSVL